MKSTFNMTAQETEDELKSRQLDSLNPGYYKSQHILDLEATRAPKTTMTNLRFFWNGIKASDGKIQRVSYSNGALLHSPAGTITIYGRDYRSFSAEIRAAFTVENDSEMQTDYFEKDRIRVTPDHPLYSLVNQALQAHEAHYAKRFPGVA